MAIVRPGNGDLIAVDDDQRRLRGDYQAQRRLCGEFTSRLGSRDEGPGEFWAIGAGRPGGWQPATPRSASCPSAREPPDFAGIAGRGCLDVLRMDPCSSRTRRCTVDAGESPSTDLGPVLRRALRDTQLLVLGPATSWNVRWSYGGVNVSSRVVPLVAFGCAGRFQWSGTPHRRPEFRTGTLRVPDRRPGTTACSESNAPYDPVPVLEGCAPTHEDRGYAPCARGDPVLEPQRPAGTGAQAVIQRTSGRTGRRSG